MLKRYFTDLSGIAKTKRKGTTKGMARNMVKSQEIERYSTTAMLFKNWNSMEAANASINQSDYSQKSATKPAANPITRFRNDGTEISLGPVNVMLYQQTHRSLPKIFVYLA